MKTRQLLAVLAVTGGLLFLSACGDDNDTRPRPGPPPTSTQPPPPFTNTPVPAVSHTPTNTPNASVSPSLTPTGGPGFEASFTCDVATAYICKGGSNDGKVCRPVCHLQPPGESCNSDEIGFCGGGQCVKGTFFCKGGPLDGQPCTPGVGQPCGEGGRCQNSELSICTELACPTISQPVAGNTRLAVTCDANGCRGELLVRDPNDPFSGFDPVLITGIGMICVRPAAGEVTCPSGRVDCGGGARLDYDLIQDHNIGPCSGNQQCIQMCEAHCQAMNPPRQVAESGCAGWCEGGTRNGLSCGCDRVNFQCFLPECPEGSCAGLDNPSDDRRDICGCQCLEEGGDPGGPGGLNFQIPAQIIVESDSDPYCGVGPVLITLPPQCIPWTTEKMSGVLRIANNKPATQIPPADCMQGPDRIQGCVDGKLVRHGRRVDCDAMKRGDISNLDFVGNISFFDSSIGDIEVELDWFCK